MNVTFWSHHACIHAFFKKEVYKKVYIKWLKIKKVFIYSMLILRNFFVGNIISANILRIWRENWQKLPKLRKS